MDQNVAVAHLYFNYRDQDDQTTEKSIASLLKQLAVADHGTLKPILELYRKLKSQDRRPQLQDLEQIFRLACQNVSRVFVVVDALDECSVKYRKRFLQSLSTLQSSRSMSVLLTSRSYDDYVNELFGSCPRIKIQARDSDLRNYISNEIEEHYGQDIIDQLRETIVERVVQSAHNMYVGNN